MTEGQGLARGAIALVAMSTLAVVGVALLAPKRRKNGKRRRRRAT